MKEDVAKKLLTKVAEDYETIAGHFSDTRSHQWYEVSRLLNKYIKSKQKVLDLGCGNGRVAQLVTEIKADYIGLDVSKKLIALAQNLHPAQTFVVANMMHTPFADNSFDHTLLIASLHHLPSAKFRLQTLQEAKRLTKPGGYIIMTNWNLHQWRFFISRTKANLKKIIGNSDLDWNDLLIPWKDQQRQLLARRYYHGFTKQEIKKLAKKAQLFLYDQYFETRGIHCSRRHGQNLVSVLQKQP
ncbi:MAG: hypothetical protein A2233_01915 [Candidatus Kerfeldbacteria bacterium RIFOXYA2_FULL_38_24]|uniref:Methyltransferase type 11 domain-containing protein n=1 Tax=Candidatus Kerfeldbacteria bacterium RIFOXYB2_FULL_38_14 TaxID=1798547 RepID=A0A1G2BEW2_9BACT|nr:MAG: hypothetical protein A2319_04520 [Candidatus Kerfeldbacteria bacterium RIFOXYB2_FULL_38_14]OGY87871.1 MAG: hypothetical protein A2233_01915 [Candidatus Kerfeldbacteria bacterium RIFOXYA2_FULL_38_24]OGY90018.1 MAG: hypothetical protein A2458_00040 [Candidatus Kerfeldbacteria bacterium RIFOXYC2_FULL_38_9]